MCVLRKRDVAISPCPADAKAVRAAFVAGFTAILGKCREHLTVGPSDSRLRLTGTIVALAGARAQLKFRSENSNAFSHGDQKMSTSEAPPEAGRRTPATQLQLSN